jgi:NAD(P)-dependent dehydrogenase (short-subunit alcohol dehydrogenase family)
VHEHHKRIDILLLNAGGTNFGGSYTESKDVHAESIFVTNYLGNFLLVELLKPLLVNGSRVVAITSASYIFAPAVGVPLTEDEVQDPRFFNAGSTMPNWWGVKWMSRHWCKTGGSDSTGYNGAIAYSVSKFATVLHVQELASQLRSSGVVVASVNPGTVLTPMLGECIRGAVPDKLVDFVVRVTEALFTHPRLGFVWKVRDGCLTQLYAATSPDVSTLPPGAYLVPQSHLGVKDPRLENGRVQKQFWALSLKLVQPYLK